MPFALKLAIPRSYTIPNLPPNSEAIPTSVSCIIMHIMTQPCKIEAIPTFSINTRYILRLIFLGAGSYSHIHYNALRSPTWFNSVMLFPKWALPMKPFKQYVLEIGGDRVMC
jgi:hypothetical protein